MSINPKAQKEFEKAEKFREQYIQTLKANKTFFLDHYHSQAVKHYEAAGSYDHPRAQYRLAVYYSHGGTLTEEKINFKNMNSLDFMHRVLPWLEDAARNGDPYGLRDYAKYLVDHDEKNKAIQFLEKAVKLGHEASWILLANLYHDEHFYQKEYDLFRDHEPTNLDLWMEWPYAFRVSLLHYEYGERAKGINCLRRLSDAGDYKASVKLSTILEADGETEKAIEVYLNVAVCKKAIDEVDEYVEKARNRISEYARSHPETNQRLLKLCLQTLFNSENVQLNDSYLASKIPSLIDLSTGWIAGRLGIYYVGVKGFEEIGFNILSQADGHCLDPEVTSVLGDCYYEGIGITKNIDLAIPLYERYHKVEGNQLKWDDRIEENHHRYLRMGSYYYGRGNYNKILAIYHHYDQRNLLTSSEYNQLVYIYRYVNLNLSQEESYKKIVEYGSKSTSGYGQNQIGVCYFDGYGVKKDFNKALHYFLEAAQLSPSSSTYLSNITKTYIALGDLDQASLWAKKVEKVDEKEGKNLLSRINVSIRKREAEKLNKEMADVMANAKALEKEGKINEAFDTYLRIGVNLYNELDDQQLLDEARAALMRLRKGNDDLNRLLLNTCLHTILKDEHAELTFVSNASKAIPSVTKKNAWLAGRLGVYYKNTGLDNTGSINLLQASFKHLKDPEVAMYLGDYYNGQKQYADALACYSSYHCVKDNVYELAKGVDPSYDRLEAMAGIYYNQNNYTEAFHRYSALLKENKLKLSGSYDVLGYLYFSGNGVQKDLKKAYACFKVSRSAYGRNMTGHCLFQGFGTEKNIDEALECFIDAEKISSQGLHQYNIGCCYEDKKDYEKALEWFKKAEANKYANATKALNNLKMKMGGLQPGMDVKAMFDQASKYETTLNYDLAFNKYKEIALLKDSADSKIQDYISRARASIHRLNEQYPALNERVFNCFMEVAFKGKKYKINEIPSHVNEIDSTANWVIPRLGIYFLDGIGTFQDYSAAFAILQRACQLTTNYEAQTRLGDCYYYGYGTKMNFGKAKEYYEKNTYFRNGKFEYNRIMPSKFYRSVGVAWSNYKLENYAVAVLQFEALMKTEPNPQPWLTENLAWCYYNAKGTQANKYRSFELCKMQKTAYSLNMLGLHYYNGEGCAQSYRLAFENFVAAEKLEHRPAAQFNIALCYEYGHYVPKDIGNAIHWYDKASKQNYEAAKTKLKTLRGY